MSHIIAVAARWTKSLKFTLSIAVHTGGLAKNYFWLVATQKKKKKIGEQLNYLWNMCPKPFSWTKNKRKLFSDGKSRGALLARAALNLSASSESGILFLIPWWLQNLLTLRKLQPFRFGYRAFILFRLPISYPFSPFTPREAFVVGRGQRPGVMTQSSQMRKKSAAYNSNKFNLVLYLNSAIAKYISSHLNHYQTHG